MIYIFFCSEKILAIGDNQVKIDPFRLSFQIKRYDLSIFFANGFRKLSWKEINNHVLDIDREIERGRERKNGACMNLEAPRCFILRS